MTATARPYYGEIFDIQCPFCYRIVVSVDLLAFGQERWRHWALKYLEHHVESGECNGR